MLLTQDSWWRWYPVCWAQAEFAFKFAIKICSPATWWVHLSFLFLCTPKLNNVEVVIHCRVVLPAVVVLTRRVRVLSSTTKLHSHLVRICYFLVSTTLSNVRYLFCSTNSAAKDLDSSSIRKYNHDLYVYASYLSHAHFLMYISSSVVLRTRICLR